MVLLFNAVALKIVSRGKTNHLVHCYLVLYLFSPRPQSLFLSVLRCWSDACTLVDAEYCALVPLWSAAWRMSERHFEIQNWNGFSSRGFRGRPCSWQASCLDEMLTRSPCPGFLLTFPLRHCCEEPLHLPYQQLNYKPWPIRIFFLTSCSWFFFSCFLLYNLKFVASWPSHRVCSSSLNCWHRARNTPRCRCVSDDHNINWTFRRLMARI